MNLTESSTKETLVIDLFANGLWSMHSEYSSWGAAEQALAMLIESTINNTFEEARIVRKLTKITTDRWLVKHVLR